MLFEAENKRASARKRLGAPALVRIEHRIVRCAVKDVSLTGAMLVFPDDIVLPGELIMSIGERPGTVRRCKVVWQDGRAAGVTFLGR
jgi:hypothetical protein